VRAQKRQLEEGAVVTVTAIDEARRRLGAGARLIIGPSGTEPVIRIMGEGDDPELVEKLVTQICGALKDVAEAA
jgi:phosphoglucosamine mutase